MHITEEERTSVPMQCGAPSVTPRIMLSAHFYQWESLGDGRVAFIQFDRVRKIYNV